MTPHALPAHPPIPRVRWIILAGAAVYGLGSHPVAAQSLMEDSADHSAHSSAQSPASGALPANPPAAQPAGAPVLVAAPGPTSTAEKLQSQSLFAVVPPKPKSFQKHDLVEIIINESSTEKTHQKLDTKKNYGFNAELTSFPSVEALLEAQIRNNPASQLPATVGVKSDQKLVGEGTLDRSDNFVTRVSAKVVDVKPNGTLVLESRYSQQRDEETYTLVLSGTCRSEDITKNNTIQSNQLADLTFRVEHEGQVKKSAEKGLIPRLFDFMFNF